MKRKKIKETVLLINICSYFPDSHKFKVLKDIISAYGLLTKKQCQVIAERIRVRRSKILQIRFPWFYGILI